MTPLNISMHWLKLSNAMCWEIKVPQGEALQYIYNTSCASLVVSPWVWKCPHQHAHRKPNCYLLRCGSQLAPARHDNSCLSKDIVHTDGGLPLRCSCAVHSEQSHLSGCHGILEMGRGDKKKESDAIHVYVNVHTFLRKNLVKTFCWTTRISYRISLR